TAMLALGRLPVGTLQLTGAAYTQACTDPMLATLPPAWIADPVTGAIAVNASNTFTLTFRANNSAVVSANFVKGVTALATGAKATYAVMSDGVVRGWGSTGSGAGTSLVPIDVPGGTGAVEVTAGGAFGCLRTAAGAVSCWGMLPLASSSTPTATPVTFPGPALQIAAGKNHMCALIKLSSANNPIYCFGANASGQLGNLNNTDSATPVPANLPTSEGGVYSIAAGNDVTCALTALSRAYCWGKGTLGHLGNNGMVSSNVPVRAGISGSFKQIAIGS